MKNLIITILLVAFALTSASAQDTETTGGFSNGDVYLTGSVGFNSFNQGEIKSNAL